MKQPEKHEFGSGIGSTLCGVLIPDMEYGGRKNCGQPADAPIHREAQDVPERCPKCGHAPHKPSGCLNAASDNDCDCKTGRQLPERIRYQREHYACTNLDCQGQHDAEYILASTAEAENKRLRDALRGVAIMLNTELKQYEEEPWAQRVREASEETP